jgi:hypothetical protein
VRQRERERERETESVCVRERERVEKRESRKERSFNVDKQLRTRTVEELYGNHSVSARSENKLKKFQKLRQR